MNVTIDEGETSILFIVQSFTDVTCATSEAGVVCV